MPVLPRTTPVSVGRRARNVPVRPATASERTKASRIPGFSRPARMTAASVRAVIRSSDDRPEPSTSRTPSVGMSAARISAITTAAPRALVPTRPSSVPRCLRSISAVKLSLSRFMRCTIAESGSDVSVARGTASTGAIPIPIRPATAILRAPSALRSVRAARSGGESDGQPCARSTTSADSGGVSPPTKYRFQPSAPRRLSNADSSPRIRPVTRRIPLALSVETRPAMSAEDNVGSPSLRRYRSPSHTGPPAGRHRPPRS